MDHSRSFGPRRGKLGFNGVPQMGFERFLRYSSLPKNQGLFFADIEDGGFNAHSASSAIEYEGQFLSKLLCNMFGSGWARSAKKVGGGCREGKRQFSEEVQCH